MNKVLIFFLQFWGKILKKNNKFSSYLIKRAIVPEVSYRCSQTDQSLAKIEPTRKQIVQI